MRLKKAIIVILLLVISFWAYVEIVNRNSINMTVRQKILKAIYPAVIRWSNLTGKRSKVIERNRPEQPPQSIYDLTVTLNNGNTISISEYKGKKILLVNTASDCGYTNQYEDLQKLYEQFKDRLMIIGFPANDFKEQEKGSDDQIASFCKLNYGITFPLAKKSTVIKSSSQNEVFKWLTDKNRNGWNEKQPSWNFSKYLVNERGILTNYFDPAVSPTNDEVIKTITK